MASSLYVLYMLLDPAYSLSGLYVKYISFRQLDPFRHKTEEDKNLAQMGPLEGASVNHGAE
jgi:hypothetical protein